MKLINFNNSTIVSFDSSNYPKKISILSTLNDKVSFFALAPLCHLTNEPTSCMQKAAVGIGVQELLRMSENQSGYEIMTKAITGALKSFAFVNSYFCDLKDPETMEFCAHTAGWYAAYYSADYLLNR